MGTNSQTFRVRTIKFILISLTATVLCLMISVHLPTSLISPRAPLWTLLIRAVTLITIYFCANASPSLPPWHLDRLDQYKGLDSAPFQNAISARIKPVLYVIDSGVNSKHLEFFSRTKVISGYNFVDNSWDGEDCLGHGTHVAALAAGSNFGVAGSIGIDIVSVRILDCFGRGTCSAMIKGMEWCVTYQKTTSSE